MTITIANYFPALKEQFSFITLSSSVFAEVEHPFLLCRVSCPQVKLALQPHKDKTALSPVALLV